MLSAPFRRSASLREAKEDPGASPETGQDGLMIRKAIAAWRRKRALISPQRSRRVREFRSKWSRQQAASEAKRRDGLTDEQHKAMMVEFDRRVLGFREKWRLCPVRRCRRQRQCLGPPFSCLRKSWMSPWKNREYRRLRRDIVRDPPQVQGAG
jgi:hypothetical protein